MARTESGARGRLLRSAFEAFSRSGFEGATTREISRRAGCNEVTLFRLFGSKEALFLQAVRAQARSLEVGRPPCAGPGRGIVDDLARLGIFAGRALSEQAAVLRVALAEGKRFPGAAAEAMKGPMRIVEELAGYFQALQDSGARLRAEPKVAAVAFFSLYYRPAMAQAFLGKDALMPPTPKAAREYARIFAGGILEHGGSER